MIRSAVLAIALFGTAAASAQQFNIDLDHGPPQVGGGAPAFTFGAAAAQPGLWNRLDASNGGPYSLLDIQGSATSATLGWTTSGGYSGYGFNNPANTGDFALLLNDSTTVGTVVQGGSATFTFSGLNNGAYQLYTYAVSPNGGVAPVPVFVPGSTSTNPQSVSGPMPGNAFGLGITHSIHDVLVTTGTLQVIINVPPNLPGGSEINGFQLVPEPGSMGVVLMGAWLLAGARRRV